jgi:hypothetical protein
LQVSPGKILRIKTKGGILLYALFVLIVILVICVCLLGYSQLDSLYHKKLTIESQMINHLHSGINLLMADHTIPYDLEKDISLYGESTDSVRLNKTKWGIYDLLFAECHHKKSKLKKAALAGNYYAAEDNISLYLTDNNRPLNVCGKTELSGNVFLPAQGIKRSYIEGKNYTGSRLVYGTVLVASKNTKQPDEHIRSVTYDNFNEKLANTNDKNILFVEDYTDSLTNSFFNPTKFVFGSDKISLSDIKIIGNIIVISNTEIQVSETADLQDIILVAPKIKINEKCTVSSQLVASDSVIISPGAHLAGSSSIVVNKTDKQKKSLYIEFGEDSKFNGTLICYDMYPDRFYPSFIKISNGAEVQGFIYTNGSLQHSGKTNGSLYCNKFYLRTPSAVYENHLLDASIGSLDLENHIVVMEPFNENKTLKRIKWLD